MTIVTIAVPLDGWLVYLAAGWQLPNPIETWHAYQGPDGAYAVRMWALDSRAKGDRHVDQAAGMGYAGIHA